MKNLIFAVLIPTAFAMASCFTKPPTRTERPALDTPPWSERSVTSGESGNRYNYMFAAGPSEDSETIVLLHGGFIDQRMWINMHGLTKEFDVVAMEWPNESPFYTGNVADYGRVVAEFINALGLDELFIGGVSNGAYGAIEYANRHPDKVKALLIFASVMFGITPEEVKKRTALAQRALDFGPKKLQRVIEWNVERTEFPAAPGSIQLDDIFYTRPWTYYKQIFSVAVNQGAKRQDTSEVSCPVLVLHGSDDETMPVDTARLTVNVFDNARFMEFTGKSHSFVFTTGDPLVSVVLDFVREQGLI